MNMKNAKWRLACQNLSFTFPLKIVARPFRWPIASVLSVEFGKLTPGKPVSPTARACRERMERFLEKYINEDKKAFKRYIEE